MPGIMDPDMAKSGLFQDPVVNPPDVILLYHFPFPVEDDLYYLITPSHLKGFFLSPGVKGLQDLYQLIRHIDPPGLIGFGIFYLVPPE
ncbi:MAG: hypothetical protein HY787_10885 [Deltaproteobacteria bacterium]|nr:hypothetical protein [Deltaproteobacteria bacterium]